MFLPLSRGSFAGEPPERGDALLVERMQALRIVNVYQQELGPGERAALPPFVPIRILREHDHLGDGFTPCMSVQISGSEFYILRDERGDLAGWADAGYRRMLKDVRFQGDTVRILERTTIADPERRRQEPLGRGEKLIRHFTDGNLTYVSRLEHPRVFGWISLPASRDRRAWEIVKAPPPVTATLITPQMIEDIRSKLTHVNRVLEELFSFFGTQTGRRVPPPRWELDASTGRVVCVVTGKQPGEDFSASTRALTKDIELTVLGSGLLLAATPDSIEIRTP